MPRAPLLDRLIRLGLLLAATVGVASTAFSKPVVVQRFTAFPEGVDGVNCHRIPSLVTAGDGTLLLACEARRTSWKDRSPTDVVLRRSGNGGRTWSTTRVLLPGGADAQMDPCLLVDRETGRIFLLACRWPAKDHSARGNTAWLTTSTDNGLTWSKPENVTDRLIPSGSHVNGFGPGSGIQLSEAAPKPGRLVVPVRLLRGDDVVTCALCSDDHGKKWSAGKSTPESGEFQIAEAPDGRLVANFRDGPKRPQAQSSDAGGTWTRPTVNRDLPSIEKGCQSSVLGVGKVLLYTGPAGVKADKSHDNRGRLTLRRSLDGGRTWPEQALLSESASGYSCLTRLKDGRIAVVLEAANTPSFTLADERQRWMRLDVLVLSADVADPAKPLAER